MKPPSYKTCLQLGSNWTQYILNSFGPVILILVTFSSRIWNNFENNRIFCETIWLTAKNVNFFEYNWVKLIISNSLFSNSKTRQNNTGNLIFADFPFYSIFIKYLFIFFFLAVTYFICYSNRNETYKERRENFWNFERRFDFRFSSYN